jgi:hypothetical protein
VCVCVCVYHSIMHTHTRTHNEGLIGGGGICEFHGNRKLEPILSSQKLTFVLRRALGEIYLTHPALEVYVVGKHKLVA